MINLYADGNTLLVEVTDITNDKTGELVVSPTVAVTLKYAGLPVSGQTWPLELTEDSSGNFSGLISADADIVAGRPYLVMLSIEADSNFADFRKTVYAKTRDFSDSIL